MSTKGKIIPNKRLKLYEETDFSKMTVEKIYLAGKNWKSFDFDKGLDALIKLDKNREYIYLAGKIWKHFDFDKGLDALIKLDKSGKYEIKVKIIEENFYKWLIEKFKTKIYLEQ